MSKVFLIAMVLILFGCAAAGIPFTSDPKKKLQQSEQLLGLNRPIPAQKLIHEALDEYKKNNDEIGMAYSYQALGIFYQSQSYHQNKEFFEKFNEYDPTYEKSIENLKQAIKLFDKNSEYFSASNAAWNLAGSYQQQRNKEEACNAFDMSLDYHNQGKEIDPEKAASASLPKGFSSMKDVVNTFKSNYGC